MISTLLLGLASVCAYDSAVIMSEFTPSTLRQQITDSILPPLVLFNMSDSLMPYLRKRPFKVLFDYTNSMTYSFDLRDFAIEQGMLYYICPNSYITEKAHSIHVDPETEGLALQQVIKLLEWDSYHLIPSYEDEYIRSASVLYEDALK